jgi:hypothetical protein
MGKKTLITALLAGGIMLVAGCSSGSSDSATASSGAAQAGVKAAAPAGGFAGAGTAAGSSAAAPAPSAAAGGSTAASATTARVVSPASIVYTAQLTVRASSVSQATAQASQIAEQAGGYVAQESASAGTGATATIQLKIPVTAYNATLSTLSTALGKQLSLNVQAQDVTEQVADVTSQVASDQAAITQLRGLLAHAGSVGDLLNVQNQINAEESSLEQMEAQQRALSDETAYATVTLTITGPPPPPVVYHAPKPPPSLTVAGAAKDGLHALRVTVMWALTVLAASAPFAVVAALALFVGYRVRRWRRGQLHN